MTSASIVAYKTDPEEMRRVIDCALRDGVQRLYVIDHSPSDILRSQLPDDSRIAYELHPNRGYGAGHNIAIRKAMAEGARYHAVLNPDVYWEGDVITPLARYMDGHPDVAQMLPKVLYPDGSLQYTCKLIPTPFDLIANRFLPQFLVRKRLRKFRLEESGYSRIMNVPYMHGCFMMLKVEALHEAGLFDERFFMYPEDIDLTRRLHEKWQTLFYPPLSIYHAHARESRTSIKMLLIHITNMVKYFNKWGWLFDRKRRHYNRRLLAEIVGDGGGSLPAGSHGEDYGGGAGDSVTAGKDTGA